ncbi:MAG: DUF4864 domain-containing protein [Burkholderiales bacterium]|nr:DUF4864 domain-containing protein [Burkholderiales bacterium]
MHPLFTRFAFLVALAFCAATAQVKATAGPLADGEAQKIQQVIVAQLAAFADDDADKAFETATPGVREAIGSSYRFLAMVRGAYPMVYRPNSVSFLKPEEAEGTVLQLVEITDGDDKSWLALFALERQPDETWRIGGCLVSENRWQAV